MKARFTTFKLFLMQHLFVVGLVLLFVVLSFCSCGRAAADGMIQSDRDYIHSIFDEFWGENEWSTVEDYMNSMPYFIIFKESGGSNYVLYLAPYSTNDYYEARYVNGDSRATGVTSVNIIPWLSYYTDANQRWSFGTYYGGLIPYSLGNLQWDSSRGQYGYAIFTTGILNGTFLGYRVDIYDRRYSDSGWNRYWYDSVLHGISNFNAGAGRYDMYVDLAWTKTNFNAAVILGEYTSEYHCPQNVFPIEYVSDDRLKLSTSLTGDGSKLLNIDLSAFRGSYTPAASFSFSDVVLHLDCDGTDVSYTISSLNSELVNSWNPFNNRFVFITPYSVFDLANYDDVYISGVDFSLTHSSPGGSDTENFKISAEYFLKHETAPIESDDIPFNDNIYSDSVTSGQITSTLNEIGVQSVTSSNGIWNDFDLVSSLPNFPSWASVMSVDIWQAVTYSDGSIDEYLDEYYYRGYDSQSEYKSWYVETNPFDFPSMNYFSQYYDVLVLQLGTAVKNMSVAGSPHGIPTNQVWGQYLVLYSARYYQHKNVEGIYNLIDIFQKDANQSVEFMNYTKSRLDDFENKSLVAFNTLIGLDRQNVQWLSTLNNSLYYGFDSVLSAINNIDIPEPTVFDDSDILDKLDDLITAVQGLIVGNEVDTPQECIQYYYDNQNGTIDLAFVPAYYEGMTLDFLYSIQGETQNNNRSGTKSGGGSATFVNDSLIIQIFNQFKDSFTDNFIPQNIRVFLSDITNDTGNHMYYFQLFHNDYDPEDFDGLAD